jgi:hypothetical protein
VFFSGRCPLLNSGLSIGQRLLYTGACWSYITNTVAVPLAVLVPFLAIVFGILPFNMNRWARGTAATAACLNWLPAKSFSHSFVPRPTVTLPASSLLPQHSPSPKP